MFESDIDSRDEEEDLILYVNASAQQFPHLPRHHVNLSHAELHRLQYQGPGEPWCLLLSPYPSLYNHNRCTRDDRTSISALHILSTM